MTGHLSPQQRTCYQRDGYLFPVEAFDEETALSYRVELERAERLAAGDPERQSATRSFANLCLPFADTLSRLPSVTEPVASILGEDLLVWGCTIFVKEPETADFISWHQDLHYWGLDDDHEVTAWLALSPATEESGCMRFVPGSHTVAVEHSDTFDPANMLSRGQEVAVDVDESAATNVTLRPGQMSLHHGRTFHASYANRSNDRRIGVAIRYISPQMKQDAGTKTVATLVRGRDAYGHFELFDGPRGVLTEQDLALRRRAIELNEIINYRGVDPARRKELQLSENTF